VAAGCLDGKVRIWELATGGERCQFQGHRGGMRALSFAPDGTSLVTGSADTTALLWDLAGRLPEAERRTPLSNEQLTRLSSDLESQNAATAFRALQLLAQRPEQAVAWLGQRLHPVRAFDPERTARLLRDLDSNRFAQRKKATQELEGLGDAAEPALRGALEEKPSVELQRRVQGLLQKLGPQSAGRLHNLRALEILERLGTSETRKLLTTLAEGEPDAWLTQEAKASLNRLRMRGSE
jgi:hypothetical protein